MAVPVIAARGLIRLYQVITTGWPRRCRFEPSCSAYCRDALAAFGFWKGLGYGITRILKCHPWHAGGYDPILR